MQTPSFQDQYWCSLPFDDFVQEAHQKIEDYYNDIEESGLFYLWLKSFRAYYGARLTGSQNSGRLFDSSEIQRGGKAGEISHLKCNHYRNLILHTVQLATAQRPAYQCRATNSDYKSQTQTILGNGLIDYYMREKNLERYLTQTVEHGLVFSEGWIHGPWNVTGGEKYDLHPETGAPIYEGDLSFSTHTPLDVPRDITLDENDDHDWLFIRTWDNKWDLAAKYPEMRDEILSPSGTIKYEDMESFCFNIRETRFTRDGGDRVPVWVFYHKKTESMPQGRMVQFVGQVALYDGPIPYRSIPLWGLKPQKLIGSPYGYSPAFDLLGPQQGVDILSSTIMTNQAAHGVQSIWTKRDDTVSVTTLSGGMKNLQSDEEPRPIQLTRTAGEIFNFRQELIGEMETLSGINSTVRGNPEANLKSGSALALVVSQSIQFSNMLEGSFNRLVEDVGTSVINHLRDFSKTERVANILGESSRPFQKEFTGDDLSEINRVVVERASPLSKTISGRIELANNLMEKGFIETGKQYITVLTTGQLDPAIEGIQHELLNVRAENESMRDLRPVSALVTDIHADHIREHKTLLSNPEARQNPAFVKMILDHIQEHIDQWRSTDPAILMITGQQPPPPKPVQPPQPGQPSPEQVPQVMDPQQPIQEEMPNMPNMPNMPQEAPPEAQAAYDQMETI